MNSVKYVLGESVQRPWGMWRCVAVGDGYIVKIITVNPNSALSLQMHDYRSENWLIVKGQPTITVGDTKKKFTKGQSVYIPVKTKHRLENLTDDVVEIIEIQTGDVLDENDIIRFEDIYNRK